MAVLIANAARSRAPKAHCSPLVLLYSHPATIVES